MKKHVVLFCTTGTTKEASYIAEQLVQQRLVACVNIIPSIQSVYRWEGNTNRDKEVLLILKTSGSHVPALKKWIRENHSYESPELIVLPIEDGLPGYLKWIDQSVSPRKPAKR